MMSIYDIRERINLVNSGDILTYLIPFKIIYIRN